MARTKHLVLIGAGRMGAALARGWIASDADLKLSIIAPRPSPEVREWGAQKAVAVNPPAQTADYLVIAVKPQVFGQVLETMRPWVGAKTVIISVMAGISLKSLKEAFGSAHVFRAMPNTPGAIGQGVTLLCAAPDATPADIRAAQTLLEPLGDVEGPIDEKILPAATAISGCGPAYVFLLAEVMAMAGEAEGLPPEMAARLARRTVEGAAMLLQSSNDTPAALRRAVTSPKGVTAAALDILMDEGGMPSLMRKAQRAAAARDKALAKEIE